jgi:hypothetical protein
MIGGLWGGVNRGFLAAAVGLAFGLRLTSPQRSG